MWIVSQIGAREHYSIPRALHRAGQLAGLTTDFWVPPGSLFAKIPGGKRLQDRFHAELGSAPVHSLNSRLLVFEGLSRLLGSSGWDQVLARDALYQRKTTAYLRNLQLPKTDAPTTLFSYSYTALEPFKEAKRRGWKTVLGQIDPGPAEHELVNPLRQQHPEWAGPVEASPPQSYWDRWREECELADRIVVNSEWSKTLLSRSGIESGKIEIIPLALDAPLPLTQESPPRPPNQPLRLLFLGQAIVRKGIQDLVAAAKLLEKDRWHIDVVGPHGPLPDHLPANMTFHGSVPRSEASHWYSRADAFVLPTHSDGFALTQLEAMVHGLPVIATACCGEVVEDGQNGWIIPAGDPDTLAQRLTTIAKAPEQLASMSESARDTVRRFNLGRISTALLK